MYYVIAVLVYGVMVTGDADPPGPGLKWICLKDRSDSTYVTLKRVSSIEKCKN